MRTGKDYLRSLNDGRSVFVDGERVADVTRHPAFREAARSVARLYDIAAAPELRERMTFVSPKTGEPVLRAFQIPHSHADLRARRLFSETWAEATFGLMGRTPDHVAGFFCGYAATPGVLATGGQKFADNVVAYYEHIRDNHLYLAYAIVPPQIDRSKPAHQQSDPTLYAGVVEERDDGIVISGAQQLATGGAIADEIHLSCIHPLAPGDENYANCLTVAVNAPGLRLYPRRPFALRATNAFDYPLSSRFDESDSYVVFDNVFVPWERVFIYRNIALSRDQWFRTPSHAYGNHQAQVRYVTKLRFMIGLAQRMNEMTGNAANPAVQIMMGELAALVTVYESMLLAHETAATIDKNGVLWPSTTTLYAAMALQSELNGRMLEIIRELAGAAMITLPSSLQDFESPETAGDVERYMRSASSDAKARVALMRLAWDFIGSEFGSRHQQYEKFYGGASFLVKQNVYRNFDFNRATALVDAALALPPLDVIPAEGA
jgi:4-hydroxyphenylacetate 3-monooxygenase